MNNTLKIMAIILSIGGALFVLFGSFIIDIVAEAGSVFIWFGILLIYVAYRQKYKLVITDSLRSKIINNTVRTFALEENPEYVKVAQIRVSNRITDKKSFWKKSVSSMLFTTNKRLIIVQSKIIGTKTLVFLPHEILQCSVTNLGGSSAIVVKTMRKMIAVNAEFEEIAKDIENEILKLTKPQSAATDINQSAQIKEYIKNNFRPTLEIRYGNSVERYSAGDFISNYESVSREGVLMLDSPNTFVAVDVETTGLSPRSDEIIQIGAIKYENGVECDRFMSYVKPTVSISPQASKVNNIYDDTVADAPDIKTVLKEFINFVGDNTLIAHNAPFDMKFLQTSLNRCGMDTLKNVVFDTLDAAKFFLTLDNYKLETISKHYGMDVTHHEAVSDCSVCARLYLDFLDNITPEFDEPTDDLFFCALDDIGYFCCEKGWSTNYGKYYKKDIREEIAQVCEERRGRCYKSKAKSAKYVIILCNLYQTKDRVQKWRNMGYKVVSLDTALKYLGIYEKVEKMTIIEK